MAAVPPPSGLRETMDSSASVDDMNKAKKSPDSELNAQKGINLIEEVVLGMGHRWYQTGPFDSGIDGRIELRDARSEEPLNQHLSVQSKAWAKFTTETEDGFEFLCSQADIDYWMRSDMPVLLICSHPATREAWYRCVTDWFIDAERRASRRVTFDKRLDRFDASKDAELLHLATRDEPILHRKLPAPPEELVTNLLPIHEHSRWIWGAPSPFTRHNQVRERYEIVGGPRASDYILRDGLLYSLRDPFSCPLKHLCEREGSERIEAETWSESNDPVLLRYWVELLRRALLQQMKYELQWHPERKLFYFPATEPLADRAIEGANGKRQVVKVAHYLDKQRGEQRLKYVRHHAFRPGFQHVDGRWFLTIEPDYLFTYDGERKNFRGDEYLAVIKRFEKNLAVVGHLRMWEYLLTRPPSLLRPDVPLLTFGELTKADVPVGIDDALWRGKQAPKETIPGQEELAA